jgi:cellulose synthase operon protein C
MMATLSRQRLPWFIGSLLLASLASPAQASVDAATRDWEAGDANSALIRLKNLLQDEPDNADARLLLGKMHLDNLDASAAEQQLMRARDAGAGDLVTRALLVEALLLGGDTTRALEWTEAPAAATPAQRAELLALRGSILLQQQKPTEAADAFAAALEADPDSLRAMLGTASLAMRRGMPDEARESLRQAIEAHPDSADAWQALAQLERLEGNHAAAAEALTQALTSARVAWPLYYQRAEAHLDLGDRAAAASDIDRLQAQRPELPALAYLEGRLLLLQRQTGRAVEKLENYLRTVPNNTAAIYHAALALNLEGRHAQAEEYLRRVTSASPSNAAAVTLLARTQLALGDARSAEQTVRQVADGDRATPLALELLRQALLEQGRADEAAAVSDRARKIFADRPAARLAEARRLAAAGDAAGALPLVQGVLDDAPDYTRARIQMIRTHHAAGDLDAALSAAEDYLAQSPDSPHAHVAKGALLLEQDDVDGARAAFNKALELDPSSAGAAQALAVVEIDQDRPEQARRVLEAFLAVAPDNPDVALALAALEHKSGGPAAFRARLEKALDQNPAALPLRLRLADSHVNAGDVGKGLDVLTAAPAADRHDIDLLWLRAQAEVMAGDMKAAQATLSDLAERRPETPRYRYMLASLHARSGDLRAAESHLRQGLRADDAEELEHDRLAGIVAAQPTAQARKEMLERLRAGHRGHPALQAAWARLLMAQGDYGAAVDILTELASARPDDTRVVLWRADAIKVHSGSQKARGVLQSALAKQPNNLPLRFALAQLSTDAGDRSAAIAEYRRILELNADNAVALNNLAALLAEEYPEDALRYVQRALEQYPDEAAFLDTKGTALMARGDIEAAVEALAKAHADSANPTIAFHYARALAKAGEAATARRLLLELQALSFPEKAEADALLAQLATPD